MEPIVFNAKWHKNLLCLKKNRGILSVFTFFFRFFLGPFRKICRKKILPSSSYSKKEVKALKEVFFRNWFSKKSCENPLYDFYIAKPLKLITPDGVSLSGTYFRARRAAKETPVIVLFQSNSSLKDHSEYDWLLAQAAQENHIANFITFDYRGCGTSYGKAGKANDLILDGDTAYQFVKDYLKVSSKHIILYGFSLGGAVSAQVCNLYPDQFHKCINERSFSSLTAVISSSYRYGKFLAYFTKKLNWEFNTLNIWPNVKGKKLLIYQPKDEIIPLKASLFYNLSIQNKITNSKCIQLEILPESQITQFYHSTPLNHYIDQKTNLCAQDTVIEFLFEKSNFEVASI